MADNFRAELSKRLHNICENVYFNEPDKDGMVFPCIIYHRKMVTTEHANNNQYMMTQSYQVTYMSRTDNPEVLKKMLTELPYSNHTNEYINDGIHHSVFDVNITL